MSPAPLVVPPGVARVVLLVLLGGCAGRATAQAGPESQPAATEIRLRFNERIPMRDGITLSATLYGPADPAAPPRPVICTLTPYIADNYHPWALHFAKNGYAFAAVDLRGRGNSGGTFEPFVHDPADGHDVVEWLAEQPWCDGRVALWGSSYMGFNQWATLRAAPRHLATILPVAAAYPGIDFPIFKNISSPYNIRWLTMTSGVTMNNDISGDAEHYWISRLTAFYRAHRPFRELDSFIGNPSVNFQRWVAHPTTGPYWDATVPAADHFAAIDLPILTITGHYDADQWGALEFYRRHMAHGPPAATARHYLIIGPWDHGGCVNPRAEFKGLAFGAAAVIDMRALQLAWYDWTLRDGPRPELLSHRVAYYVPGSGAECWRHADSLAHVTAGMQPWFLQAAPAPRHELFRSGTLSPAPPPGDAAPSEYTYDPLDITPAEFEQTPRPNTITDQSVVYTLGGRGVIFHTPPLDAPLELAGVPRLTVWIELDVPDTDFVATLSELLPDGTSVMLSSDSLRARYRDSPTAEELVQPGRVERYTFDQFNFFARRVQRGSRLRLVLHAPNSIFAQKNYNSGGVVADETAADARTARVRVYHDSRYPSVLELPLGHAADSIAARANSEQPLP
ncbi:MAG: CocE/NonD family hydrolase [Phycisphaerales bacterium]|nr:CocE/NonD family hydrolase [Phycisphaerales bacterium]